MVLVYEDHISALKLMPPQHPSRRRSSATPSFDEVVLFFLSGVSIKLFELACSDFQGYRMSFSVRGAVLNPARQWIRLSWCST